MNISELEQIKKEQQVIKMYVESYDNNYNLVGYVANKIKASLPFDELHSVSKGDIEEESKHIVNKVGKKLDVCIKDIITDSKGKVTVVVSKKILELKVRKWMYMHLKPGIKLKGFVTNVTEFAAFIDVGGGVTGILKLNDIEDVRAIKVSDLIKPGQRLEVVVKKFDRDTGRIEFYCKDFVGSFEKSIKKIKEGDIIDGIVRDRLKSGVFVELKPNLVGLAEHVSGIEYGQKVLVSVKKIIPEKKKIKLIIIG